MQVFLPNSAFIGNIEGFLRHLDTTQDDFLRVSFHEKWVSVHPVVLAITACLADHVRNGGGEVEAEVPKIRSLPYLVRMGLFSHLGIDPVYSITDHESSGRFVPSSIPEIAKTRKCPAVSAAPPPNSPPPQTISEVMYGVCVPSIGLLNVKVIC